VFCVNPRLALYLTGMLADNRSGVYTVLALVGQFNWHGFMLGFELKFFILSLKRRRVPSFIDSCIP
jgi:hypothetical protein